MDLYGDARRPPPLSRAGLVFGLYGAMALIAILLSAGRGDPDLYTIEGTSTGLMLALSPLLGVVVGLAVVVLSRLATARFRWARALHRDFQGLLGALQGREILVLAFASAVGEELMFRGALQGWIGLWPQAVLFALLHIGPGVRFLPWTASALVIGVGFGFLYQVTGDLGAPIVAHFTINYLNLRFIAAVRLPDERAQTDPGALVDERVEVSEA
jgi:membrane protease YdiL (CAAX protease family)